MSEIILIPIVELMEKTEHWLLEHGYKKTHLVSTKQPGTSLELIPNRHFMTEILQRSFYFAILVLM